MGGGGGPFADGERLLVEDVNGHRYALTCRYRHASPGGPATGYVLATNFGTLATYDSAADVFRLTPPGGHLEVTACLATRSS